MKFVFLFAFVVSVVGIVRPFIRGSKRWHFAIASIAAFFAFGASVPPPTPQQLAAREKAEAKNQAAKEKAEAKEQADATASEQAEITTKAVEAISAVSDYTRAEYPDTYRRVGNITFAKLDELEPGAMYAAAESKNCDVVEHGSISDRSTKNGALWFVDCKNGKRFMVTQGQAKAALSRFKSKKLALADLVESCTTSSVAMCNATTAQKNAKEAEIVTFCDILLKQAVKSPSTLDIAWQWKYAISDEPDIVIVQRDFDSQNGFGAMIRSRYHCEVNAASGRIAKFLVEGPTGTQKIV